MAIAVARVLVALDASAPSAAALEEAARLAHRLRVELAAVFVEDVNLLHLAGLRLARDVDLRSGAVREIDLATVESMFRAQAARAERQMYELARQRGLTLSFHVVRGHLPEQVAAAATENDLTIIGWARPAESGVAAYLPANLRARPGQGSEGSTARAIAAAGRSVLVLREANVFDLPPAVVFDGSDGAARALAFAAGLAMRDSRRLVVLLMGDAAQLAVDARHVLQDLPGLLVEFAPLREASAGAICAARAAHGCGIVALAAASPLLDCERGHPLDSFACPLLLVG